MFKKFFLRQLLINLVHAKIFLRINAVLFGFFFWFMLSQGSWYTVTKKVSIKRGDDASQPYALEITARGKKKNLMQWLQLNDEILIEEITNFSSSCLPTGIKLISYKPIYH